MKDIIIKVNGMECTGCENRVQNALKTIPEIVDVKADHESGIVKIVANNDIPKDVIKSKIDDIGFEVVEE